MTNYMEMWAVESDTLDFELLVCDAVNGYTTNCKTERCEFYDFCYIGSLDLAMTRCVAVRELGCSFCQERKTEMSAEVCVNTCT